MAACRPARQCTLIMPLGHRCGSPALRDHRFCYHHSGRRRALNRERLEIERLERLSEKLRPMTTSQLLNFLQQKLITLPKTLRRFPEVSFTLTYTLDHLYELSLLESRLRKFHAQNQEFQQASPQPATKQGTYPHDCPNQ